MLRKVLELCRGFAGHGVCLAFVRILILLAATTVTAPETGVAGEMVSAESAARDVVVCLYRDFAWEAVMPGVVRDGFFVDQPRAVLEKYLDPELASLVVADAACRHRTRELCALEFVPLFDSQDPAAFDLEVERTGKPDEVRVTFSRPNSEQVTTLLYKLRQGQDGWRITDIMYQSSSTLKTILSRR